MRQLVLARFVLQMRKKSSRANNTRMSIFLWNTGLAVKYSAVWNIIKTQGAAEIIVNKDIAHTVVAGIKRTKCVENVRRKTAQGAGWSKLVIRTETADEHFVKIRFELLYSTVV